MVVYTYDGSTASDQKHGFLKFWTLNFENGVRWSSGTTLDDSPEDLFIILLQIIFQMEENWNKLKML